MGKGALRAIEVTVYARREDGNIDTQVCGQSGDARLIFNTGRVSPGGHLEKEHSPSVLDAVCVLRDCGVECIILSGYSDFVAWCWREQCFACLSHEPARENDPDSVYSVIDGQFLEDELVSLKLRLDDSAALQVILLTNEEGSGRFAVGDAELVGEGDFKLLCSQIVLVGGVEGEHSLKNYDFFGIIALEGNRVHAEVC